MHFIISLPFWTLLSIIFPMMVYGMDFMDYVSSTVCKDRGSIWLFVTCKFYFDDDLFHGGQFYSGILVILPDQSEKTSIRIINTFHNPQESIELYRRPDDATKFVSRRLDSQMSDQLIRSMRYRNDKRKHELTLHIAKSDVPSDDEGQDEIVEGKKDQGRKRPRERIQDKKVHVNLVFARIPETTSFAQCGVKDNLFCGCTIKTGNFEFIPNWPPRGQSHLRVILKLPNQSSKKTFDAINIHSYFRKTYPAKYPIRTAFKCSKCADSNPSRHYFILNIRDRQAAENFLESAVVIGQQRQLIYLMPRNQLNGTPCNQILMDMMVV